MCEVETDTLYDYVILYRDAEHRRFLDVPLTFSCQANSFDEAEDIFSQHHNVDVLWTYQGSDPQDAILDYYMS